MVTILTIIVVPLLLFILGKISKKRNGRFFVFLLNLEKKIVSLKNLVGRFLVKFFKFFCAFFVLFWPLFFWFWYLSKLGYVPVMSNEDLPNFLQFSFLEYSISRWWDQAFWLMLIFSGLLLDILTDRYEALSNILNGFLIVAVLFVCSLIFLCGSIYSLVIFFLFFLIYFGVILIIRFLKNIWKIETKIVIC